MPRFTAYFLDFKSGLHVGQGAESLQETLPYLPADTLFAAMVSAWRHLGGDATALVHPFVSDPPQPPFLLTSAFPYAGGVRFYPFPVDWGVVFSSQRRRDVAYGKMLKRIRYFSEGLMRKAQAGEPLDAYLFPADEEAEPEQGVALQGGALWLLKEEVGLLPKALHQDRPLRALRYINVWREQRVPRVTVDRVSQGAVIYHSARVVFAQECGLWFGVAWRHPEQEVAPGLTYHAVLAQILKALEAQGVGGERSSGYGAFSLKASEEIDLPEPQPDRRALLLSRYHPREDEVAAALQKEGTAYTLVAVGGWLHSPDEKAQRRKRLWLVNEGSLVGWKEGGLLGNVPDVRPEYNGVTFRHPVYRYGLAVATAWPQGPDH